MSRLLSRIFSFLVSSLVSFGLVLSRVVSSLDYKVSDEQLCVIFGGVSLNPPLEGNWLLSDLVSSRPLLSRLFSRVISPPLVSSLVLNCLV